MAGQEGATMKRPTLYPGFWHAVLLCVTLISLEILFVIPCVILGFILNLDLVSHPATLGITNLVACAGAMWMGWVIGRPPLGEVFTFRRISPLTVLGVILASGGLIVVLSEADNLVRKLLPMPESIASLFRDLWSPRHEHFWATVFLMVIVAPVTEELVFRGLILRGFLQKFSLVKAAVLSAMLFGAVHLNPWQFVSGSGLGLVAAWWYARTRSLLPCLLGHALVNALFVGGDALPFRIPGFNQSESYAGTVMHPLWFDALGMVLLVSGSWVFCVSTPAPQPRPQPASVEPPAPPLSGSDVPPELPPDCC
jgi:membrane protease YdiL (CAAX protease family)